MDLGRNEKGRGRLTCLSNSIPLCALAVLDLKKEALLLVLGEMK